MKKKPFIQCVTVALSVAISAHAVPTPAAPDVIAAQTPTAQTPAVVSNPATPTVAVQTPPATTNTAETLRDQAKERWQAGEKEQALALINKAIAAFPNDEDNYFVRSLWMEELNRYDEAIADARRLTELDPNSYAAWSNLGWFLILRGDFPAAQIASAKAQALQPDTYEGMINLGHTYLLQGDQKTAHRWYEKAIPFIYDKKKSGPLADFDLFIKRGWQVTASQKERQWFNQEAQPMIKKFAEATELNKQANKLYDQEQYAQAEPLYKRALAIREKALGADHLAVANILNNLAGVYYDQEQYAQAEPLYKRALAINEKALGAEHLAVAENLNNLADIYKEQKQYAQAEPLYKRSLAIWEKALGAEHPDVAESLDNLAWIYITFPC